MAEDSAQRLQNDLAVVMEKVQLCREIMLVSPGIEEDEMLANVVGYLEACRDRMGDLIEAGFQGLLGEELFEKTLSVNDAVNRTLEAERTGTKIAVNEEEVSAKKEKSDGKPLLDLGEEAGANAKPSAAAPPAQEAPKPKPQDTLLAPYVPSPAPAAASTPEADPFGSDFVTKPFDDLPVAPTSVPSDSDKVYLPQADPLPPAPTALEAETVTVTASVKDTTAVVPKKTTPEAEAEDFDAFLESLGTTKL